jgi:NTE family protein
MSAEQEPIIAIALSGGGARAIAFHLGCLRALHDRKILGKIKVMSTVSGGSVIGACWAYRGEDFAAFDRCVVSVLRRGLQRDILREACLGWEAPKILGTLLLTGTLSLIVSLVSLIVSRARRWLGIPTRRLENWLAALTRRLPVWGSLTTAFEPALARRLFGNRTVDQVQRAGLTTIVNACDLTTGTAFRFGSQKSGGWRYGTVTGTPPTVAKAVAASAAFPILLPPLVEAFEFEKKGRKTRDTVSLTDGGVFDNLGVAVLEPGRADDSIFNYPVSHIISLNAGAGQFEGEDRHYWWLGRMAQSFKAVHRKAQDAVYQRLHKFVENGELCGFGLIYLGQQDAKLPWRPSDLVLRGEVRDYPTDFAPMPAETLELLTKRGEQLTQIIVDQYLSGLGD